MNNNTNKQIFYLDQNYKNLLRKICCQVIKISPQTALEWEDLYWEFLYYFAHNKIFNPNKNITFATFIGIECKNFSRNKIKKYLTRKHKVLNNYVAQDKIYETKGEEIKFEDDEIVKLKSTNYINSFQGIDAIIINEHLIDGKSVLSLSKRENIS